MQGSIGVMLLAMVCALLLVAGTSSLPWVAGICVMAGVVVGLEQRRTRSARQTPADRRSLHQTQPAR